MYIHHMICLIRKSASGTHILDKLYQNDDEVLEIDNLILKTYLADVSTRCSSPQGEMHLDWVRNPAKYNVVGKGHHMHSVQAACGGMCVHTCSYSVE